MATAGRSAEENVRVQNIFRLASSGRHTRQVVTGFPTNSTELAEEFSIVVNQKSIARVFTSDMHKLGLFAG